MVLWIGDEFPEERGSCLVPIVAWLLSMLVTVVTGCLLTGVVSK